MASHLFNLNQIVLLLVFRTLVPVFAQDDCWDVWDNGTLVDPSEEPAYGSDEEGRLVVFGGKIDTIGTISDTLARFDPTSRTWEILSNGPVDGRRGACADIVDQKFIAFGGMLANGTYTNSIFVYDLETFETSYPATSGSSIPVPVREAACCVHNGFFYVHGGYEDGYKCTFHRISLLSYVWEELSPLPVDPNSPGYSQCAAFHTLTPITTATGATVLVEVGGIKGWGTRSRRATLYDPVSDSWQLLPIPPDYYIHSCALPSPDGRSLMIIGGDSNYGLFLDTIPMLSSSETCGCSLCTLNWNWSIYNVSGYPEFRLYHACGKGATGGNTFVVWGGQCGDHFCPEILTMNFAGTSPPTCPPQSELSSSWSPVSSHPSTLPSSGTSSLPMESSSSSSSLSISEASSHSKQPSSLPVDLSSSWTSSSSSSSEGFSSSSELMMSYAFSAASSEFGGISILAALAVSLIVLL